MDLPHDWVVDLPFAAEASHSHGYKTVGYKYPETSVGWYRKTFTVPAEDEGSAYDSIIDGAKGYWVGYGVDEVKQIKVELP